ncbi:MAG: RsmB/NOP family class I SAM-dependent RNA methyltransferase [Synergistes sp.]|nr:RsmB/NOP family class I SAM-dependent RNA methyltransferase [Synergistes sp.]
MRGLEAALILYQDVQNGAFASEALRKIYNDVDVNDRKLAATLLYCTLRRQSLWRTILIKYCRRDARSLPALTAAAITVGIAGLAELKYFALPVLVNGIIQAAKKHGAEGDVGIINAVLHNVAGELPNFMQTLRKSSVLSDQALYCGVPGWAAARWSKDFSIPEAKKIVKANGMRTYLSLRLSRGVDRDEYLKAYNADGNRKGWASPFLDYSVRTAANPYPADLPGYSEGKIMPQSESSMLAAEMLISRLKGGYILDMCCGRGVKTGQIADSLPNAEIEAWDVSDGKIRSAQFEMMRMKADKRVNFKIGDSLTLTPDHEPDAVLLDAPCSGSGTWSRHPESKWRCTPQQIEKNSDLQIRLFERAVNFVKPGGLVLYSTCSIFRSENEKVVADVIARHQELIELNPTHAAKFLKKGKPYGTIVFPALPWVDGFYMALFKKRK